jgi:hypothetical protein
MPVKKLLFVRKTVDLKNILLTQRRMLLQVEKNSSLKYMEEFSLKM